MAWISTATTVMVVALAVAPGNREVDPEGPRGTAEVTGEVRVDVEPAPYASLNGEGEGTARLEVEERTDSGGATEGDFARFQAQVRLGEHRLELTLNAAGRPANADETSEEEREAAREAAGGVAMDGFWSGPVSEGESWGTRRADILAWGTAKVSLDGRELTDAARMELAAFAATGEGAGTEGDGGRLHVIVRDVPELSTIRMHFPEGVRLERGQPAEGQREDQRVAARSDGSGEGAGPEVLTDADALIPDEGPIPQKELEDYVVVGTLPGPMLIEIDAEDVTAPDDSGTGGSGESEPQETSGAGEQERERAAAAGAAGGGATAGSGDLEQGPQRRTGQDGSETGAEGMRADAREQGAVSDPRPQADVQLPQGAGGSGSQQPAREPTGGATGQDDATRSDGAADADGQVSQGTGGSGNQEPARERSTGGMTGNDAADPDVGSEVDDQLVQGTGGSGGQQVPGTSEGTTELGEDGRIRGIAPANIRIEAERVEVLQDSPRPMNAGTDTLSGVDPLNAAPSAQETRALSPGIEPLTSDVLPSSTGLPPPTEVNDGVLPSTVTFGPGAGGGNRFGPGIGGSATTRELEAQRQQQRQQEQSQGTVRPLGTLGDVPEMPAPIQPLNTAPASSMPQGIQPLNAQPVAPPR